MSLAAALPAAVAVPLSAQQVRRPAVVNGRRYLQYDAFTDKPLTGNQLAVFSETGGADRRAEAGDDSRGPILRVHLVQSAEAAGRDPRLRFFGPANEMQFAGHPVVFGPKAQTFSLI